VIVQPVTSVPSCGGTAPQRLTIFRSVDDGHVWTRLPIHLPGHRTSLAHDTVVAVSARRFWLTHSTIRGDQLFESRDAGKHWHARDLAVLAHIR
jgi:photosystem II stability/assembly factor-like uncharacterized protein